MTNDIVLQNNGNELVVDSRIIAERLGVTHEATIKTIEKYATELQRFGVLRFEIAKLEPGATGRPQRFAWLNENQATLLMSFSRNTAQVTILKVALVAAFSEARSRIKQAEVIEIQQPVQRVLPTRDAVDYANAAKTVAELPNGILKQLIGDMLVDELSVQQNLKYLPVAEKPKQYTIVKIRAKALGYSEAQIKNGSDLGKFVKSRVQPAFAEPIGRYESVNHYEVTPDLDQAINDFFER
jgi:phage regulator Rha-like protein